MIRLNELVSDGKTLSDEEWIDSLEAKTGMRNLAPSSGPDDIGADTWPHALTFYTWEYQYEPISRSELRKYFEKDRISVSADDVDMAIAHELLNRIEAANEDLRKFLTEKFKFEDVL